jgi:hypothetical protein
VAALRSRGERRCRWSSLPSRVGVGDVAEDLGDHLRVEDESDDSHPGSAPTGQGIRLVDPPDHLSPGSTEPATLGSEGKTVRAPSTFSCAGAFSARRRARATLEYSP